MKGAFVAAAMVFLSACGSAPPALFETPAVAAPERVRTSYSSVAVREVSLPSYAAAEEIVSKGDDGRLGSSPEILWADDPVRAVTLGVARALKDITRARVAPDPWPYQSRPDVSVDIRFGELLPSADGSYMARGLYFVAPEDEDRSEHAHDFEITVPFDPNGGFGSLVAARSRILNILALDIAKTALR